MPGPGPNTDAAALIEKLQKLTRAERLRWSFDERLLRGREHVIGHVYTAEFGGSIFAIHEFQYAHYVDEDEWYWVPSVRLELIDKEGRLLYEFGIDQVMGGVRQLLELVRRQTAGVDQLLEDLLATKEG